MLYMSTFPISLSAPFNFDDADSIIAVARPEIQRGSLWPQVENPDICNTSQRKRKK